MKRSPFWPALLLLPLLLAGCGTDAPPAPPDPAPVAAAPAPSPMPAPIIMSAAHLPTLPARYQTHPAAPTPSASPAQDTSPSPATATAGESTTNSSAKSNTETASDVASGSNAPGPGDIDRASDYARPVGAADDPTLSTGWTSGHGARTQHVTDYYRHTKSGGITHVHSSWRRPSRR